VSRARAGSLRDVARGLNLGRAALGASMAVMPRQVARPWIGRDAGRPATAAVVRAHGIRDALLGVLALRAIDGADDGPRLLRALAVVDAVDLAVTYAARRALPRTSVPLIAALAGAAVAGQLCAARHVAAGPPP
jgi:hypothetical protein